jgi:histidinol-phosphate aminotransferase
LLAQANGIQPENILISCGSDEAILIAALAFGGQGVTAVIPTPTFGVYKEVCQWTNTNVCCVPGLGEHFEMDLEVVLRQVHEADKSASERLQFASIVFLCRPNNPTGKLCSEDDVRELLKSRRCLVVLDEAYHEFCRSTLLHWVTTHDNLIVLRTLSKAYALAGLRLGYMVGCQRLMAIAERRRLPYNVGAFSQLAAMIVLQHAEHFGKIAASIRQKSEWLQCRMALFPSVSVLPSVANFVLFRTELDSAWLHNRLAQDRIHVRHYPDEPLLDGYLRVSVGTDAENEAFLRALCAALETQEARKPCAGDCSRGGVPLE